MLNKADLVPFEVMRMWLHFFFEVMPASFFMCSTDTIAYFDKQKGYGDSERIECIGSEALLTILKNYISDSGINTPATVGIIRLPNVGKSSLINSLLKAQVVELGNIPSTTKTLQEVQVDEQIKLLDSPGIILTSAESETSTALKGLIKTEQLMDPLIELKEIFNKVPIKQLMQIYKIQEFNSFEEFFILMTKTHAKSYEHTKIKNHFAARIVLTEWCNGKIPHYKCPPKIIKRKSFLAQFAEVMVHKI